MAETNKPLRGVIPAPITPVNEDGTVRYDLFEAQIDYLLTAPENQEAVRRVLTSLGVEVQP